MCLFCLFTHNPGPQSDPALRVRLSFRDGSVHEERAEQDKVSRFQCIDARVPSTVQTQVTRGATRLRSVLSSRKWLKADGR